MELLIIGLLIVGFFSIFWIWMFVDCLLSPLPSLEKAVWLLIIFFTHFIGALLYFFMARGRAVI